MHRFLATLILATAACGGRPAGVVATTAPPADTTWRAGAVTRIPTLDHLVATVESYASNSHEPSHRTLAETLRALADAVEVLVPGGSERIASTADRLARSSPDAAHAELVREALDDAIRAIETRIRGRVDSATRQAFVTAVDARDRVVTDTPLLRQHGRVHLALASLTNAIAAVHHRPAPFVTDLDTDVHRSDLDAFARQCRRAVDEVAALAATAHWTAARARTAAALEALSRAVAHVPTTADVGSYAITIRYQALRLARANAIDQRGVDWTKAGLVATVRALAATSPPSAVVRRLLADADNAADALDATRPFPFQRAAIQDALRAVAATCVALAVDQQTTSRVARRP